MTFWLFRCKEAPILINFHVQNFFVGLQTQNLWAFLWRECGEFFLLQSSFDAPRVKTACWKWEQHDPEIIVMIRMIPPPNIYRPNCEKLGSRVGEGSLEVGWGWGMGGGAKKEEGALGTSWSCSPKCRWSAVLCRGEWIAKITLVPGQFGLVCVFVCGREGGSERGWRRWSTMIHIHSLPITIFS